MLTGQKTKLWYLINLPPVNIVTKTIPHDHISAGWALYIPINTSGATYGKVPQRLSSSRSFPCTLFIREKLKFHFIIEFPLTIFSTYYLNNVAIPKSDIFRLSFLSRSRFSESLKVSESITPPAFPFSTKFTWFQVTMSNASGMQVCDTFQQLLKITLSTMPFHSHIRFYNKK